MARRGFGGNALRAALGAVTGVAEGMRLREEREFEREKEKAAAARQAMLDAAALRGEERQAAAAGMIPATQYTGLSPFDMPGATPRQPLLRQTIGGREMVLPEAPKMAEHRAGVAKTIGERKEKEREAEELGGLYEGLEVGGRRIIPQGQGRALARMPVNTQSSVIGAAARIAEAQLKPTRSGAGGAKGPSTEDLLRAEAQWNSLTNIPDSALNPEEVQFRNTMVRTFDKLRASPSGKGAPALNLIFQAVAAAEAQNKRLTAPPKAEGGDDDADLAEARRRQAGQQGGVAPTPAQRPAAAPTTAPAAPKPPAEPTSMADAAAKQASRAELWDKLKSQNPKLSDDEITARVMREIP